MTNADEQRPAGDGNAVSPAEVVATIRWWLAIKDYLNFNDKKKLEALIQRDEWKPATVERWLEALNSGELKRRRGRPPQVRERPEAIVQLVWKQKLQAGLPFTNEDREWGDLNPCFYIVADNLGCSPAAVRRHWRAVPKVRRDYIHDWLKELLREHGLLHPRHR